MPASPFDFFDKNGYENHVCACFKDPICCLGAWCCTPCTVLCWPIGAFRIRRRVNELYNKTESEDGSMCAIGCLPCCAISQDGHEVRVHRAAAAAAAAPADVETANPPAQAEAPTA